MKSKVYILLIALFVLLVLCTSGYIGFNYYVHNVPSVNRDTIIDIPKGEGLRSITSRLNNEGVIGNENLFMLYVVSKGWQNRLKAGEYEFKEGRTVASIVDMLVKGEVVSRRVTIPEGLTVAEIAGIIGSKTILDENDFLEKTNSPLLREELLGDASLNFEGYLFPETYTFTKDITSEELIKIMVGRFRQVFDSLRGRNRVNLSDQEILILASIIEKETGKASERPLIAAVFHNRLRYGMKLESDPTVIYGMGTDYNGNITKRDLRTETEYNTYIISGLPPGPIASPGTESLRAAINPAPVKYIYFVSKGDGSHHFSANYRDHQNAVNKYQR